MMSKKRPLESIDEALRDPYSLISLPPVDICTIESHKRKKNCRNNPWCVYGLGEYKEGIWADNPPLFSKLGKDKRLLARKTRINAPVAFPVGLTNLGATCYINVLMQSLFHNLLVRDAVFSITVPDTATALTQMDHVVMSLQEAFCQMQDGAMNVFSLEDFTDFLGINRGEQQDPEEFSKLFLGKLESLAGATGSVLTLSQLLHGKQKYVTECLKCHYKSVSDVDFTELELHIKGSESVEMSLESFFSEEIISGDNQYFCPSCNCKNDARRYTTLPSTPPVLFLQLLRNNYNRETFEKIKLKDKIRFEDTIVISDERYMLTSVLYHIGTSAYGGHYVVDALSWSERQWYHCNDDAIFPIEAPSVLCEQEDAKREKAAQAKVKKKAEGSSRGKSAAIDLTGNDRGDADAEGLSQGPVDESHKYPSHFNRRRDVYMLCYVKGELFQKFLRDPRVLPPLRVREAVEKSSQKFDSELAAYQRQRNALSAEIEHRKCVYLDIKDELTPSGSHAADGPFHLVLTSWLKSWITGEQQDELSLQNSMMQDLSHDDAAGDSSPIVTVFNGGIDNACCACPHGALDPSKAGATKVVSKSAYLAMTETIPELAHCGISFDDRTFRCSDCFDDCVDSREKLQKQLDQYDQLNLLLKKDTDSLPNSQYDSLVSKKWIAAFRNHIDQLRRLYKRIALQADSSQANRSKKSKSSIEVYAKSADDGATIAPFTEVVNQDLYCAEHGRLLPSFATGCRRVSKETWRKLIVVFHHARVVPVDGEACLKCQDLSDERHEIERSERLIRRVPLGQSKPLKRLSERQKPLPLFPLSFTQSNFYLVDGIWLAKWRKFVGDLSSPNPGSLSNECLSCVHGLPLVPRRMRETFSGMSPLSDEPIKETFGYDGSDGMIEVVYEEEWRALVEHYSIGVQSEDLVARAVSISSSSTEWIWSPAYCQKCATDADQQFDVSRREFYDSVINFMIVEDPVQQEQHSKSWDAEDSDYAAEETKKSVGKNVDVIDLMGGTRRSSRRRKGGRQPVKKVTASCTDTLQLLQLKIYEVEEKAKPNKQIIYFEGNKMDALHKTLAEYRIMANDTIQVMISDKASDDPDFYWNELGMNEQASERGFAGTFLGAERPSEPTNDANQKPVDIIPVEETPSPGHEQTQAHDEVEIL